MAPATIRTVHAILSGALKMAVRYGWLTSNPAEQAVKPRVGRPQPSAPTSDQAARLIDAAFEQDAEWGVLVWLVMVTGMRRSELAALRWAHVDLDRQLIALRAGYVVISGQGGVEKDTKTHQMRFIRLDTATVEMLREHHEACRARLEEAGRMLGERHLVFSADPAFERPRNPDAISHRYRRMATKLGIDTHLHALRHYSATELIAGGVDLRTVAGRLGHGDGTTTMKVYGLFRKWSAAEGVTGPVAGVVSLR